MYPETLSSFITSDQPEWKCSNPESFSQTVLSCQMLSCFCLVRNTRKPTLGLPLIFPLSLWVTEFAFQIVLIGWLPYMQIQNFVFAILIRPKRNSLPKAWGLWMFFFPFFFIQHSHCEYLDVAEFWRHRRTGDCGRAGLNVLCLNTVLMIGNEVWTH